MSGRTRLLEAQAGLRTFRHNLASVATVFATADGHEGALADRLRRQSEHLHRATADIATIANTPLFPPPDDTYTQWASFIRHDLLPLADRGQWQFLQGYDTRTIPEPQLTTAYANIEAIEHLFYGKDGQLRTYAPEAVLRLYAIDMRKLIMPAKPLSQRRTIFFRIRDAFSAATR